MRVALVHDYLVQGIRGAERVLAVLHELWPEAPVYTLVHDPRAMGEQCAGWEVRTSFLQRLPGGARHYQKLFALMPQAVERLPLAGYDLVVSSSIAFTHAAQTRPDALHVSYVYTPMRYAWNLDAYLEHSSWSLPARVGARTVRPALRRWDRGTAGRPDLLVAISGTVQQRIARFWGRESEVLYPPVEVGAIDPTGTDDGFYLVAARMLAYRRLDDAIAACTRLGRDLVVVGEGPERARLQALAGPTVRFPGRVDRPTLLDFFGRCHAYLVPGEEDFGIAAIEAMAAGKPVVGLRAGGVAETVIDGATGVLYDDPGGPGMANAIERLESLVLDPAAIRRRAERFDVHVFRDGWRDLLARAGIDPPLYSPA